MTKLQELIELKCKKSLLKAAKRNKEFNLYPTAYFSGIKDGFNEGFRACQRWVNQTIKKQDK